MVTAGSSGLGDEERTVGACPAAGQQDGQQDTRQCHDQVKTKLDCHYHENA